jgi:hypothetical protein
MSLGHRRSPSKESRNGIKPLLVHKSIGVRYWYGSHDYMIGLSHELRGAQDTFSIISIGPASNVHVRPITRSATRVNIFQATVIQLRTSTSTWLKLPTESRTTTFARINRNSLHRTRFKLVHADTMQ